MQFGGECWQRSTNRARKEILGRARAALQRPRLRPCAQHRLFVARLGAERTQAITQMIEAHPR